MLTEMVRQDQISNDLANAATPGYKADRAAQQSFGSMLLANSATGQSIGSLGAGPRIAEQVTDLTPEALRTTNEPLDLAIAGEGFFAVQTPAGVRYTRGGAFQAANDGTLVDQLGNKVLGTDRRPVQVQADGTVDAKAVGIFALRGATKAGDGLFTGTPAGAATGEVRTGALEGSGVDAARTMVDMMASMRAFEAGQRVIQTIDQTLGQAAGEVGRLS
ncbi:MAG: flagellar hook-basal body protein [Solirubrobacterales bacterium]|nr:flagellar hook-basal body protein [Solirubrobacterales bacterium]